jgi:cysteine synthase
MIAVPEIWKDTVGKVDIFVAGSGTRGMVCGVGKYLKMKKLGVKIIYVEPAESPIISGTTPFQNLDLLENKLLEVMKSSFSCLKVSMYTLATQV